MKYSIEELDYMRQLVRDILIGTIESGHYRMPDPARIEEQLRTYMLNGTTVDELEAHADGVRGYALRPVGRNPLAGSGGAR